MFEYIISQTYQDTINAIKTERDTLKNKLHVSIEKIEKFRNIIQKYNENNDSISNKIRDILAQHFSEYIVRDLEGAINVVDTICGLKDKFIEIQKNLKISVDETVTNIDKLTEYYNTKMDKYSTQINDIKRIVKDKDDVIQRLQSERDAAVDDFALIAQESNEYAKYIETIKNEQNLIKKNVDLLICIIKDSNNNNGNNVEYIIKKINSINMDLICPVIKPLYKVIKLVYITDYILNILN